jgi:PAS domain S-box-containing protein
VKGARVLVVEDEGLIALDLKARLTGLGYRVVGTAATGEDAVRQAREKSPEVVLMDVRLRGEMDGIEAAARIREHADVPIVYVTAHAEPDTIERAKAAGAHGYAMKPLDEADLHTAVEIAMHQHATERKLRDLGRWLSTTLSSIGDAVVACDLSGSVTFLNTVAERLTGWSAEEARGRDLAEVLGIVEGETGGGARDVVRRVLEEEVAVSLAPESWLVRRDGTRVPIDDTAAPVRDEDGRVTGVVIVVRDASQRRAATEALREGEERLRQAQRLESIGRLAGGIAHDFNNLMTVVLGYTEMLLKTPTIPDVEKRKIEQIRQAAESAGALTRRLLSPGRRPSSEPRVVDLGELVADSVRMIERVLGAGVVVETSVATREASVRADPADVERILLVLAANARDAMPSGGRLRVSVDSADVDEDHALRHPDARPGPHVRILVEVVGPASDPSAAARGPEPLSPEAPAARTGLGLSIVHGLVTQSGGHVTSWNEPGRGTSFAVWLPAVGDEQDVVEVPEAPTVLPEGRETVLVVEDDAEVRPLVASLLRRLGYTVLEADGFESAGAICRDHAGRIDALLTDVVMPDMRGPELADRLRAIRPGMRVLLMSGYSESTVASEESLPPGYAFLAKPFTALDLATRVRAVLSRPAPGS